jgi:hypothetical protein
MDVACAGVVGVAHEQVDEPDDGRLRREVADIRGALVVVIDARQLDVSTRARGEPLDRALDVAQARRLDDDLGAVHEAQVIERIIEERIGRGRHANGAAVGVSGGAHAMVEEIIARESVGEHDFGCHAVRPASR